LSMQLLGLHLVTILNRGKMKKKVYFLIDRDSGRPG